MYVCFRSSKLRHSYNLSNAFLPSCGANIFRSSRSMPMTKRALTLTIIGRYTYFGANQVGRAIARRNHVRGGREHIFGTRIEQSPQQHLGLNMSWAYRNSPRLLASAILICSLGPTCSQALAVSKVDLETKSAGNSVVISANDTSSPKERWAKR